MKEPTNQTKDNTSNKPWPESKRHERMYTSYAQVERRKECAKRDMQLEGPPC
jgi:hypothetical protein